MWARTERLWLLFDAGRWDEIVIEAEPCEDGPNARRRPGVDRGPTFRARVLAHRGRSRGAPGDGAVPAAARQIEDLQVLAPALWWGRWSQAGAGERRRALDAAPGVRSRPPRGPSRIPRDPAARRRSRRADRRRADDVAELLSDRPVYTPRTRRGGRCLPARLVEAAGPSTRPPSLTRPRRAWERWGVPPSRPRARGRARCREAMGEDAGTDERGRGPARASRHRRDATIL